MIQCVVVYGQQDCGKAMNSEALMNNLGCSRAVDIDEMGDLALLGSDVLVQTNDPEIVSALKRCFKPVI